MLEVFTLTTVLGARVNDDTLPCVIAHHVTVSREDKSPDINHQSTRDKKVLLIHVLEHLGFIDNDPHGIDHAALTVAHLA